MEAIKYIRTQIAAQLNQKKLYLATAESCTGGLLGHWITDKPGSSAFYVGGVIAYANQAKVDWLQVSEDCLDRQGAVSRAAVELMASGIRNAFSAQYSPVSILGVSISGIAGPSGGTKEKPVGTVWIAVESVFGKQAEKFLFTGERGEIKHQAAQAALTMVLAHLIAI